MSKYVALQPILYNGRMHLPGETINCADPALAKGWIENDAVSAPGDAEPPELDEAPQSEDDVPEDDAPEVVLSVGAVETPEDTGAPSDAVDQPTVVESDPPEPEVVSAPGDAEPPKLGRAGRASKDHG